MASNPCGEMKVWVWEGEAPAGSQQPRVSDSGGSSHSLPSPGRAGGAGEEAGLLPPERFEPGRGEARGSGGTAGSSAMGLRPGRWVRPCSGSGRTKGCQGRAPELGNL